MLYQLRNADGSHSIWQPHKVVCVAKNYADHAAELNSKVPGKPTFFIKPNTSLCDFAGPLQTPRDRGALHHEIELGLVINKRISRPDKADLSCIDGYVLALDLTLRTLQTELREQGYPWEAAKAFAGACPVSPLLPPDAINNPAEVDLSFSVNGELRQQGNTRDLVYPIERLLADAAEIFVLEPGDVLLTGTPAGVGPLEPGDEFSGSVNGLSFAGRMAA